MPGNASPDFGPGGVEILVPDPGLEDLAARIRRDHRLGMEHAGRAVTFWISCGEMLLQAKTCLPHGSFLPWLADNVPDFGHRQAQKYMKAARDPAVRAKANSCSHLAGALRLITDALDPAHGTRSGDGEYYTPDPYLDAVREVLGAIDLDPASCPEAQGTVRAARIYTAEDDGLVLPWFGRVFVNPPYARGAVDAFVAKLL